MPKYRKLYTKTVESLDVNEMPDDFTRLFWVLLPLALCREGRGLDNAAWLKSKLFPLREDVSHEMVYDAFQWCIERGMIETYQANGRSYFHVPTFHLYQGETSKEAASDYPPPLLQTYSGPTLELVESESGTDADANADADADATATTDAAIAAAVTLGCDVYIAWQLVDEYGARLVLGHALAVQEKRGLTNPPGFLISQLKSGAPLPALPEANRRLERHRFIGGEYAEYIQH